MGFCSDRSCLKQLGQFSLGVTGCNDVLEAQVDGVHAQMFCDLVNLCFTGEVDLGIAKATERSKAHLVGVDEPPNAANIGNVVGAARHEQGVAQHAGAIVPIGSAVEQNFDIAGNQRSVIPDAGLAANTHGVARAHTFEVLFAREDQLHGTSRSHG